MQDFVLLMDLIERLLHFPSMLRSIDESVLVKNLLLFPYFGVLYILQALKHQFSSIDKGEVYSPPVLVNDSLYTWYRMGVMHSDKSMEDTIENQSEPEAEGTHDSDDLPEPIPAEGSSQEQSSMKGSTGSLISQITEVVEIADHEEDANEDAAGGILGEKSDTVTDQPEIRIVYRDKFSKPRIMVNVIFEKGGKASFAGAGEFEYLDPEKEELSGFAKFLRNRTKSATVVVEHVVEPVPAKPEAESVEKLPTNQIEESQAEVIADKPVKKKKKKSKELVDRLVQQSISDNELLVSEPFAEILYAQGYKEKAIKIYEKLMLKNPEKRDIFAAKIVLINNEKN